MDMFNFIAGIVMIIGGIVGIGMNIYLGYSILSFQVLIGTVFIYYGFKIAGEDKKVVIDSV